MKNKKTRFVRKTLPVPVLRKLNINNKRPTKEDLKNPRKHCRMCKAETVPRSEHLLVKRYMNESGSNDFEMDEETWDCYKDAAHEYESRKRNSNILWCCTECPYAVRDKFIHKYSTV